MFTGTYTAIVTPFKNGEVDETALNRLVQLQIKGGVDGIVPVGTTGESPTVDCEEHIRIIERSVKFARGKIKVIAGTGANSTKEAIYLTQRAEDVGANGSLQRVDDAQRVLVVAGGRSEALPQAAIKRVLADVTEWWMAEIVTEADRLHQILVELQRPGDRARYLGHLQRVREPRAVMIAPRRDEHLGLVLETAKRLAVDDPVTVALKRRVHAAIG